MPRKPELVLALNDASDRPLYMQIVRAITDGVRRGQLRAGEPLPGSRTLARTLGVNRNTVLAAYTELAAEGWVRTELAGGTFVAREIPLRSRPTAHGSVAARPGYPLARPLPSDSPPNYRPGLLLLARALPDSRLLPIAEMARAYRRVLARDGRELLTYGHPRGHPRLRAAVSSMLAGTRGIVTPADSILITRGSQSGLDLTARALFDAGDIVAVESLGQRATWNAFRYAGATLMPVPVDHDGLRIDALEALVATHPVRAIYVTPQHQFPTTAVLSSERRRALLALAERKRIAIIEDDYDHEFQFEGREVVPLASEDRAGVVIYIGTFSKVLAPGLRVGFLVAPQPVVDRVSALRVASDLQGDLAVQRAVAELFERGEFGRHVRRMRRVYRARRDALAQALRATLGGVLEFEVPAGGMAIWANVDPNIDLDDWALCASSLGVAFRGARPYNFADEGIPNARLGFSFHNEQELGEAVARMAKALMTVRKGKRP